MTAFIYNERMQTLSQRVSGTNVNSAEVPEGNSVRIGFWRWQFWEEKGDGDWDNMYLSIGEARELAHSILETIGKVQNASS